MPTQTWPMAAMRGSVDPVIYDDNTLSIAYPEDTPQIQHSVLCGKCQGIVNSSNVLQFQHPGQLEPKNAHFSARNDDMDEYFTHHNTIGDLVDSATRGCHMCSLLSFDLQGVPGVPNSNTPRQSRYGIKISWRYGRPHLHYVPMKEASWTVQGANADKILGGEAASGERREFPQSLTTGRTDTKEVVDKIKSWLQKCLAEHETCSMKLVPREGSFLPTRLIRITEHGQNKIGLRLQHSADIQGCHPVYLALSHCWGGAEILKLTEKSIHQFRESIPVKDLPRNFQDAAILTARLGYEYLWIDSLCILQDSENDWINESRLMGHVYSNCLVSIAAYWAANPAGGCTRLRNPLDLLPCKLTEKLWVRILDNPYGDGPLRRRGWAYQERSLSPRTIGFRADMVEWQCVCGSASELYPEIRADPQKQNGHDVDWPLKSKIRGIAGVINTLDETQWRVLWWKMLFQYSICKLTFTKDRWPAFAGIGTVALGRETEVAPRKLLHGLWETELPFELLWRTPLPEKRIQDAKPSWSWISCTSRVENQFSHCHTAQAMEGDNPAIVARVEIMTPDTSLRITAPMAQLENDSREYLMSDKLRFTASSTPFHGRSGKFRCDLDGHDDWYDGEEYDVWALQLLAGSNLVGILVTPIDTTNWRRVGFFTARMSDNSSRIIGQERSCEIH